MAKRGAKPKYGRRMKRTNPIHLNEEQWNIAETLGGGSVPAGIRYALDKAGEDIPFDGSVTVNKETGPASAQYGLQPAA